MQRCLDLAQHALGATYPNPLVGAVLGHQGKIIGEGWHRMAGEPHAEVNAIASVAEKNTVIRKYSLCQFRTLRALWKNTTLCSYNQGL